MSLRSLYIYTGSPRLTPTVLGPGCAWTRGRTGARPPAVSSAPRGPRQSRQQSGHADLPGQRPSEGTGCVLLSFQDFVAETLLPPASVTPGCGSAPPRDLASGGHFSNGSMEQEEGCGC